MPMCQNYDYHHQHLHRQHQRPTNTKFKLCYVLLCLVLGNVKAFVPTPSRTTTPQWRETQKLFRIDDAVPISKQEYTYPRRKTSLPFCFTHHQRCYTGRRSRNSALKASSVSFTNSIGSHYLVRILFLRCLSIVYTTAFLVAYFQNKALVGDNGITPARDVLDAAERRGDIQRAESERTVVPSGAASTSNKPRLFAFRTILQRILRAFRILPAFTKLREVLWYRTDSSNRPLPTLLWLLPPSLRRTSINPSLDKIALVGLGGSLLMGILGAANVPLLLLLYLCQRSLMAVGGPWYSYGWEPQLAELTSISLFTVPLWSIDPIPFGSPVPLVTIWAMRWLLFRVMMGAGLIKLRSTDLKWRPWRQRKLRKSVTTVTGNAMEYFYETQPVPNPFSRTFHRLPKWWHEVEVYVNHFVELVVPWFLLLPDGLWGSTWGRIWRIRAALVQLVFQGTIILSGNLSFLNWLTMLPALYCFDDIFLSRFIPSHYRTLAAVASYTDTFRPISLIRTLSSLLLFLATAKLSVPVVRNLLSRKQIMNSSFDKFRLVNTYGAFGTVAEEREELIVSSAIEVMGPWREYEFKVKPGSVERKPRWISPYHYRLDWQMWIAACVGIIERSPWMYRFLLLLLRGDKEVLGLLERDPWNEEGDGKTEGRGEDGDDDEDDDGSGKRPKYIRVERYRYKFNEREKGQDYWSREKIGNFFPKQGICTETTLEDLIARNKSRL